VTGETHLLSDQKVRKEQLRKSDPGAGNTRQDRTMKLIALADRTGPPYLLASLKHALVKPHCRMTRIWKINSCVA